METLGLPNDPKMRSRRISRDHLKLHGGAQTSKNLQKPKEYRCFEDFHKITLRHLREAPFAPPGPPNRPPSGPNGAQRAKKASICDPFGAILALFSSLGCQIGPKGSPRGPKGAFWTHFGCILDIF